MNDQVKIGLLIVGIIGVIYLINNLSSEENFDGNQTKKVSFKTTDLDVELRELPLDESNDYYSADTNIPSVSVDNNSKNTIMKKTSSRDSAKNGYKHSSYDKGASSRDQEVDELSQFFEDSNSCQSNNTNDEYRANTDGNEYASYQNGPKKPVTDDDIFNAENYLPKDNGQDWFETVPEPISVNNRHLINVSRPIGVNTIGNSLRNPSYDIRGTPPCPKFVVSPWMQSTIEPDYNIKGLC